MKMSVQRFVGRIQNGNVGSILWGGAYNPFVLMMESGTARVKLMVVIFTSAMFYASLCSTACAAGFCPMLGQGANSDQCHRQASGHPGSHDGMPSHSNCPTHGHPTIFVNAAGPSQYQFTVAAYLRAKTFIAQSSDSVISRSHVLWGADLAPPTIPRNPLYQQISALRI